MLKTVAELNVPFISMHMRGNPQTMSNAANTQYENVVDEVRRELGDRAEAALNAGIPRWNLIVDPGIGFAKNATQNLELLRSLQATNPDRSMPMLVGTSRKRFIGSMGKLNRPLLWFPMIVATGELLLL